MSGEDTHDKGVVDSTEVALQAAAVMDALAPLTELLERAKAGDTSAPVYPQELSDAYDTRTVLGITAKVRQALAEFSREAGLAPEALQIAERALPDLTFPPDVLGPLPANVKLVFAGESPPREFDASIMLAGRAYRWDLPPNWYAPAIRQLADTWEPDGTLAIFVPESRAKSHRPDYAAVRTWKHMWGDRADIVIIWMNGGATPDALGSSEDFGRWRESGRVVVGAAPQRFYGPDEFYKVVDPHIMLADSVDDAVHLALDHIGDGAPRAGVDRYLPLLLWRTPLVHGWLKGLEAKGHELRAVRVSWTVRSSDHRGPVCYWMVHAFVMGDGRERPVDVVFRHRL
jgi:hypothetical protein